MFLLLLLLLLLTFYYYHHNCSSCSTFITMSLINSIPASFTTPCSPTYDLLSQAPFSPTSSWRGTYTCNYPAVSPVYYYFHSFFSCFITMFVFEIINNVNWLFPLKFTRLFAMVIYHVIGVCHVPFCATCWWHIVEHGLAVISVCILAPISCIVHRPVDQSK